MSWSLQKHLSPNFLSWRQKYLYVSALLLLLLPFLLIVLPFNWWWHFEYSNQSFMYVLCKRIVATLQIIYIYLHCAVPVSPFLFSQQLLLFDCGPERSFSRLFNKWPQYIVTESKAEDDSQEWWGYKSGFASGGFLGTQTKKKLNRNGNAQNCNERNVFLEASRSREPLQTCPIMSFEIPSLKFSLPMLIVWYIYDSFTMMTKFPKWSKLNCSSLCFKKRLNFDYGMLGVVR